MSVIASSPGYERAVWESFAVAEVGAAAALAGLLVVAASINIERIVGIPAVVARLGGTLALFTCSLIAGVLLLIPGLHHRLVGGALAVTGVLAAVAIVRPRALRHIEPQYRRTTRVMTGAAVLAAALIAFAGFAFAAQAFGGLYWLAPGILLAFVVGLGNSWVAMIEILR